LDIAGSVGSGDDLFYMDQFGMFIYYLIFYIDIFSYDRVRKDYTVFHYSSFFDHTASSYNGIFHGSFDEAAVGNDRIFYISIFEILGRTGIIGPGVNRPVNAEKTLAGFHIDKRDIGIIVTLKIGDRCEI